MQGHLGTWGHWAVSAGPGMLPRGSHWPCGSVHRRAALPLSRNTALCAHPQTVPGALILCKRTERVLSFQILRTWTDHRKDIAVVKGCPF